ncbi:MAG: hypothetical protein IKK57_11125 [Clostridia bacterium]|nr:hypothetical protein [Clostridia bacterium]
MKRIAFFLILTMLLCCLLHPALAWEVSPEHEALADQHLPGYQLLSASSCFDNEVLLVVSPAGETQLAFCTENVVSLTPPLPQNLFQITDTRISPDSAMLLVEDYEGTTYFVGCLYAQKNWASATGNASWQVVVSTPLPEGTEMWHTGTDTKLLWLEWTQPDPADSSLPQPALRAEIRPQGSVWQVNSLLSMLSDETTLLCFEDGYVFSETQCAHGERLFSLDVTEVDWLTLPTTVEAAAAQMDLSAWATLEEEAPLLDTPGGDALAQLNPGVHLFILGYEGNWVHVAPGGGAVSGWMAAEALFIGSRQLEAKYLSLDICPAVNPYGNDLDVYLLPSQTADSPLLIRLEGTKAQMVDELGVWGDGTWTMIYSNDIPGEVGFVRTEQLEAVPENGVG